MSDITLVGLIFVSVFLYNLFNSYLQRGQYSRSLIYGLYAAVAWMSTALMWFAEHISDGLYPIAAFFAALFLGCLVQLIYAGLGVPIELTRELEKDE